MTGYVIFGVFFWIPDCESFGRQHTYKRPLGGLQLERLYTASEQPKLRVFHQRRLLDRLLNQLLERLERMSLGKSCIQAIGVDTFFQCARGILDFVSELRNYRDILPMFLY